MNENTIVSRMNDYLHEAAKSLASWLNNMLPDSGSDWWEHCVLSNLSDYQWEIAHEKGITKLEEFDLAALLRIADRSWYIMRGYAYLPNSDRECIKEMIPVRNNWAHCGVKLSNKDIIIHDIETMIRFFHQLHNPDVMEELKSFRDEIATCEKEKNVQSEKVTEVTQETPDEQTISEIKEKSIVHVVGSPEVKGMVFSITEIGDIHKYEVFVNGELKTYYDGQIEPAEKTPAYVWVDSDEMRSYLTAYQINKPSAGNLYSLNAARIDFVPYQFRPALKLIKADEPRILIADSVGVGKTIEAGLIIKELEARSEMNNILVICPKPLVADRKWESEMKRFDEDFVPLDAGQFHQIISDTDRDGEWPARYGKAIIPYSILDSRAYYGVQNKKRKTYGLMDLDPAPHFDLVIIDAYGIIGLNSKGSANKGFLKLSPILFSPQMRLMIDLRRKHAQNEDLSAKRSAACNSGSTVSDVVPSRLLQRQSAEHTPDVDLHRSTVRYSKDVSFACAA